MYEDIEQYIIANRQAQDDAYGARQRSNEQNRIVNMSKTAAGAAATGTLNSGRPDALNVQFDAAQYLPNWMKNYQSYQTTMDKINQNSLNIYNQVKSYQDAINQLNSYYR